MTAPAGFSIFPRAETDVALVSLLRGLPTSVVSDVMGRMPGIVGLRPYHRPKTLLAGTALTVRVRSGDNLMIHKALQLGKEGDVLVVDGGGCVDRALVGEIMKNVARSRGIVGFVIDGAIRDVASYREDSFPCYARDVCHRGPFKDGPGEINVPVLVGGALVRPGDILIGDDDGCLAVPSGDARFIADASRRKVELEASTLDAIAHGKYDDQWIDQALKGKGVAL